MDHKGNALEKITDAQQTLQILQRILSTSTITTEDLLNRIKAVQLDLENAKMYIGYM
jgi:hypothetical protein